jgi:hypothetical protein
LPSFARTTTTPKRGSVNLVGVVPGGVGSPTGAQGRLLAPRTAIVDASLGLHRGDRSTERHLVPGRGADRGPDLFRRRPTVTISLREAQRLVLDGRPLATAILTRGRPHIAAPGLATLENGQVSKDLERPVFQAKQTIA